MKRVVVVVACLVAGIAIGHFARGDSVARAESNRTGLHGASGARTASTPRTALPRQQLVKLTGSVVLPPQWRPVAVHVRFGTVSTAWKPSHFRRLQREFRAERTNGYRFEFVGVRRGSYRLAASLDGSRATVSRSVEVLAESAEFDLEIELPPHDGFCALRIVGPDGEDAGPLQCTLRVESRETNMGLAGGTRSLGGGLYLVKLPERLPKQITASSLHIRSNNYGELTVPFDPKAEEHPEVRFTEPARLTIVVAGFAGSPHTRFLQVRMRPAGTTAPLRRPSREGIDESGVLALPAAQPGAMEIVLGVESGRMFCPIAHQTVTVEPGETRTEFTIPRLYELALIRTRDDVERVGVRLVEESPLASFRHAPFEGEKTVVERLLAGSYELTGYSDGKEFKKTVRVPDQSSVRVP